MYSSGDSYPVVVDGADGDILIECVVNSGGPQSTCPETIVGVAYCGDGETWSGPEEECETEDGCEEV